MSEPQASGDGGKVNNGRVYLTREDFAEFQKTILEGQREMTRLLKGDPELKVPPIRDLVEANHKRLDNIETLVDRGKWFFIGLGVLNAAQLATWITSILR